MKAIAIAVAIYCKLLLARAGNLLIGFLSKSLVFCEKNERFAHLLIFGERPEGFAHNRSFPLSDLSESVMVAHFW